MVVFRNTTHHLPEGLSSLYILFRSAIIGPRVNAKAFMLGQHIWCIQYLMRNIIWVSVYVCMCACISRGSTEQRPWAKAVTAGQRLRWILGDIFASRILVTMRFCCSLCDFLVRSFFCVFACFMYLWLCKNKHLRTEKKPAGLRIFVLYINPTVLRATTNAHRRIEHRATHLYTQHHEPRAQTPFLMCMQRICFLFTGVVSL